MSTDSISPLRQRMIEDMNARKLCAGTQRGHIRSCKQFAAFVKRSPDTATAEDIRRFQLHLEQEGPAASVTAPCPVQRWRSRISSATTERRGVVPMPDTSASTK